MTYDNPKIAGAGTLAVTGLGATGQISLIVGTFIIVSVIALTIRYYWRKDKNINE